MQPKPNLLGLPHLQNLNLTSDRLWIDATRALATTLLTIPRRTQFQLIGYDDVPKTPVIFAMNHTHTFDFLALRLPMHSAKRTACVWIKARSYNEPGKRTFLTKTANIPISSKGYVLSADFKTTHNRRPTEDEYRALRNHIDNNAPLPKTDAFHTLQTQPRSILGSPFDPSTLSFRETIISIYTQMMSETLRMAHQGVARGFSMLIYPQGSVSSRLTRGRHGVIQAALSLNIPIIPVGCSGCREVFYKDTPLGQGHRIRLEFGAPFDLDTSLFGDDFTAFDPQSEARYHEPLTREVDRLMERINTLLEPAYQGGNDIQSDGKQGTRRFF